MYYFHFDASDFAQAGFRFDREILAGSSDFQLLPMPNASLQTLMDLIDTHSINSVDALVLCSALEVATTLRNARDNLVLVASDTRLLRAAQSEGLLTFNPEIDAQQTLTHLTAS